MEVWGTLKLRLNAKDDLKDPHQAYTDEYGTLYNRNIGEILEHTFGGRMMHRKKGNTYTFDPDNLKKVGKSFNIRSKVHSSLVKGDGGDEGDGTGEEHTPKSDDGVGPVYLDIKSKIDNNSPPRHPKRGKRGPSWDTLPSPSSPLIRQHCYYCTWNEQSTKAEFIAHLERCSEIERDRLR